MKLTPAQAAAALAALDASPAKTWRDARRKRELADRCCRVLQPRHRRMTRAEIEALPF